MRIEERDLVEKVKGTLAAQCGEIDERGIERIVHLFQHYRGTPQAHAAGMPDAEVVKTQLDALNNALNKVNEAWWDVVRNPYAFSSIAEHYCEEASVHHECLERLRSLMNLEPVRFAVRLAQKQPWHPSESAVEARLVQIPPAQNPERLVQRIYEMTRGFTGQSKSDEQRVEIVRDLLTVVGLDLDVDSVAKIVSKK